MLVAALILAAVLSHVLPHPWPGFAAVDGALLVFGARRPLWQGVIPVLCLAASDWYLTTAVYRYSFHVGDYLLTWAWYVLAMIFGQILLKERQTAPRALSAALLSSTSFFLVTNYAVWAGAHSFYPHTWAGLIACFVAALPFYRNDAASALLVLALVFALPALLPRPTPQAASHS